MCATTYDPGDCERLAEAKCERIMWMLQTTAGRQLLWEWWRSVAGLGVGGLDAERPTRAAVMAPPADSLAVQPSAGGSEHSEGGGNKKRKRHRRQRGRRRGDYDEALHQKIFAAYVTMAHGKKGSAALADIYDAVASRNGVSIKEARLIVKRHRQRENRKNAKQHRRRNNPK